MKIAENAARIESSFNRTKWNQNVVNISNNISGH